MQIVDEEIKKYGYKCTTSPAGYYLMKIASWLSEEIKGAVPIVDKILYSINDKSVELLEMEYNRNLKESCIELAYSLMDIGMIKDLRKR